MSKEAMKLALEALERMKRFGNTFGYRSHEQNPYKQVCDAITALREALAEQPAPSQYGSPELQALIVARAMEKNAAEQPAQKCSYPYCGCNSKAWCKVERNEALDKMAENARELGLDYEQPAQQEPVAWMQDSIELYVQDRPSEYYTIPLYTSPPAQRTWVGLTNNELQPIADEYRILFGSWVEDFARAIEAKLKEKTHDHSTCS